VTRAGKRYRRLRAEGRCGICGVDSPDAARCVACKMINADSTTRRYASRRAEHRCVRCGIASETVRCPPCAARNKGAQ
jgi:hypothetical protein